MSNAEASKLYETVIEDVINDSRQDFEDSGIDELTLQELRRIWCEKLSSAMVAKFSWDLEDSDDITRGPLPDSNSLVRSYGYPLLGSPIPPNNPPPTVGNQPNNFADSSGLELSNVLTFAPKLNQNNLDIEFPSIHSNGDQSNSTGLILPHVTQSDGSFEFTMLTDKGPEMLSRLKQDGRSKKVAQADGTLGEDDEDDDDDIFNDSDDINSDLDDGLDSDKSEDADGDQEGQIMLCLYDKVQRIKNKWKSGLKEGIANINGKDYVFQKATGECEW